MDYASILVSRVRTVRRLAAWRRGMAFASAFTAALALALIPFFTLPARVSESFRVWSAVIVLAVSPVILLGVYAALRRFRRPRLSMSAAAGLLSSGRPDLKDLVVSGSDLSRWGPQTTSERGASLSLVQAQVRMAAEAARQLEPSRALPAGELTPWVILLAGSVCFAAAFLIADPYGALTGWRAVVRALRPSPITFNSARYTLSPPAYTGLPETVIEDVSGSLRALPGTRVSVESLLSGKVERGVVLPEGGDPIEGTVQSDREFRVAWILGKSGEYRFEFFRSGALLPLGFTPEPFEMLPDHPPEATLVTPEADLEILKDAVVQVSFRAEDDFGIERAEVVLRGDKEVRLPVRMEPGRTTEGSVQILPLRYEGLGEGAHLSVTVWDNDSVAGAKAGSTRSVYLSFIDRRKIVETIENLEERLFESLVLYLGDHLEHREGEQTGMTRLRDGAEDLLRLMSELLRNQQMELVLESPPSLALISIKTSLEVVLRPFIDGSDDRGPIIPELERDILLLDRLLRNLNMEKALGLGEEISALQRSLFDELQSGTDPRRMQSLLNRIMELMSRMNQMLARERESMPEEFVNADAVRDMPKSDLQEALERLQNALKSGNSEEARKAAEELLAQMSSWLSALEDAARAASEGTSGMMLEDMSELEQDLGELMKGQEGLLNETRELSARESGPSAEMDRAAFQQMMKRLESRLDAVAENVRQNEARIPRHQMGWHMKPETNQAQRSLEYFEKRRRFNEALSETRQNLRSDPARSQDMIPYLEGAYRDVYAEFNARSEEASESVKQNLKQGEAAGQKQIEAFREELEGLFGKSSSEISEEVRRQLAGLGEKQQGLEEKTGEFGSKLRKTLKNLPFLPPNVPGMADQAQDAMGEASGQLKAADRPGALQSENRALEGLSGIARELQQAKKKMQGGASGESGFRMVQKPGGPGSQGQDVDRSHVEIPEEMEARELKGFREDVMRAMREGKYPRNYEKDVESYYEQLIK